MEEKKGNKIWGYLLLVFTMIIALTTTLVFPKLIQENQEETDIKKQLDCNEILLDDLFLNNLFQYRSLLSQKEGKSVNYSDFLLDKESKLADKDNLDEFLAMMEEMQNNYYLYESYSESNGAYSFSKDLRDLKNGADSSDFPWYLIMEYDKEGNLKIKHASSQLLETVSSKYFSGSLMQNDMFNFEPIVQNGAIYSGEKKTVKPIKDATFIYAIDAETYEYLINGNLYLGSIGIYGNSHSYDVLVLVFVICIVAEILLAFLISIRHLREFRLANGLLHVPFELQLIMYGFVLSLGLGFVYIQFGWLYDGNAMLNHFDGLNITLDNANNMSLLIAGVSLFAYLLFVAMAVFSVKDIFDRGFINYFKTNSLIGLCIQKIKSMMNVLKDFDLSEKGNKKIFWAIIINFIIACIASSFWFFGYVILIIYSIALFVYLKKYLSKVQSDYQRLSDMALEMSQGHLDVTLDEDFGLFNDLGDKLATIKNGFKNAVDEEVKSQKMKTELISNVSHDLKTPLTTLISYIDLLQNKELSEEERQRYITILQGSSQRLKRCIDDLFEISKVESGNVQCNLVHLNLVDLIRQTQFELSDKIEKSSLNFKVNLPDQKVICLLDSSKTYRIFENLYLNILKYAMPNTRVYIDLSEDEENAYLAFKNISATEISYKGEELSERFVRNDASRNSEGSGLGLAIAKSFTELQGGKFEIVIDGDLFKVLLTFKKIKETVKTEIIDAEIVNLDQGSEQDE